MITICKLTKEQSLINKIKEDVNINFSRYYFIEKVNNLADILFDSCKGKYIIYIYVENNII